MESLLMAEVRLCFFLFKQKTAYEMRISDWSADVCSSDLETVRSVSVRSLAFRRQRLSPRLSGRPLAPPLQSSSPNCSPACASAQRSSARVLISAHMETVLTHTTFRDRGSLGGPLST